MPNFRVEVEERGDEGVVRLFGELDYLVPADELDPVLRRLQDRERRRVLIDLRGLTFIDSTGLRQLIAAHKRGLEGNIPVRLIAGPDPVRRVFELTRLDQILEFVEPGDAAARPAAAEEG
jgi:anti-sigma B factor antagonist